MPIKQNQLLRENNQAAGKTWVYTYDNSGNILSRKEYAYTTGTLGTPLDTVAYEYRDNTDILIEYDGIGVWSDYSGIYEYNGWVYEMIGSQLLWMWDIETGDTREFLYNTNGLRTQRTEPDGTVYSYTYNGDLLTRMTVDSTALYFAYDANGTPMTVKYNGTTYYYAVNLQGDVVAILNSAGTTVVSYTYDAWGRILSTTGSMASTLGTLNPLRYRSYVYDNETGLYYLQSRYYNPAWGRFLTADSYISTGQGLLGHNMFAYCGNNPVSRTDTSGYFWDVVLDVVSLGFSIAEVFENPDDPLAWLAVAADAASLVIPCVSGGGALVRAATKVDDVADIAKAANKVDDAVDTFNNVKRIHGNSLKTTKETVGYALRKIDSGEIMKFGETTRGVKRYTNKFYIENGVYMDIMARGSKYDMHFWQHNQILDYTRRNGVRPPWNKSDW